MAQGILFVAVENGLPPEVPMLCYNSLMKLYEACPLSCWSGSRLVVPYTTSTLVSQEP